MLHVSLQGIHYKRKDASNISQPVNSTLTDPDQDSVLGLNETHSIIFLKYDIAFFKLMIETVNVSLK